MAGLVKFQLAAPQNNGGFGPGSTIYLHSDYVMAIRPDGTDTCRVVLSGQGKSLLLYCDADDAAEAVSSVAGQIADATPMRKPTMKRVS